MRTSLFSEKWTCKLLENYDKFGLDAAKNWWLNFTSKLLFVKARSLDATVNPIKTLKNSK